MQGLSAASAHGLCRAFVKTRRVSFGSRIVVRRLPWAPKRVEKVSEREAQTYDCPRLGRPVVVSYLYRTSHKPAGVKCARVSECGVELRDTGSERRLDWTLCPLYPDLVREGFLPP